MLSTEMTMTLTSFGGPDDGGGEPSGADATGVADEAADGATLAAPGVAVDDAADATGADGSCEGDGFLEHADSAPTATIDTSRAVQGTMLRIPRPMTAGRGGRQVLIEGTGAETT